MNKLKKYLRNNLVALDQFANTLMGGDEDETLCSRWAKGRKKGLRIHTLMANLTDWLWLKLFGEKDHCNSVIERIEKNDALID